MATIERRVCPDCGGTVVLCAKCSASLHCPEAYRVGGDGPYCKSCAENHPDVLDPNLRLKVERVYE